RRRHTRSKRDWSSDVCSSDLDYVMQLRLRDLDRVGGDLDRIAHAVARLRGVDVGGGAFADDLELVDRVGSLQVGGDEHRTVALRSEERRVGKEGRSAGGERT